MPDVRNYLAPIHTMPRSGAEAQSYGTIIKGMPETVLDLMTSVETSDFIIRIRDEYQLDESQRLKFAEFLRDAFLGIPQGDDLAGVLAEKISVSKKTALQIMHVLEQDILLVSGLTVADLGRVTGGPAVSEDAGRIVLQYESVDDLLESIKDLPGEERIKFLLDAKKDNRVLVLKALSQLKLGTDSRGRPQTFTQLAVSEAPDFSSIDWVDALTENANLAEEPTVKKALVVFLSSTSRIARIFSSIQNFKAARTLHATLKDALARTKPSVAEYVKWSPYFAGVYDKDNIINEAAFNKFAELPDETRHNLVSEDLSLRIEAMIEDGLVPRNYGVAVAKVTFLATLGDIRPEALPTLLGQRLGLGDEQGLVVAEYISSVLLDTIVPPEEPEPLEEEIDDIQEPEPAGASPEEEPVPPPTPRTMQQPGSAKGNSGAKIDSNRNIIDLRKQPGEGV